MRLDLTLPLALALLASVPAAALPIASPMMPIQAERPEAVPVRYGFGIFHGGGLGRHFHHRRFGWLNSGRRRSGGRRRAFGHRAF